MLEDDQDLARFPDLGEVTNDMLIVSVVDSELNPMHKKRIDERKLAEVFSNHSSSITKPHFSKLRIELYTSYH